MANSRMNSAAMTRRRALQIGASAVATGVGSTSFAMGESAADMKSPQRVSAFDEDWWFYRGDARGAERTEFDDSGWRAVDLPHDWRIEDLPGVESDDGAATAEPSLFAYTPAVAGARPAPAAIGPFDPNADPKPDADMNIPPFGRMVLPGGRSQGYTVGGVGWYRKRFISPPNRGGRLVELRFDGVYRNADVWLNGVHLGFHPNGYTSFAFDLTPHLRESGENILAVRVNNTGKPSRWYSGSGIYRPVWLAITGPVRVPLWGVKVTTPVVDHTSSEIKSEVKVANSGPPVETKVRLSVIDSRGRVVAMRETASRMLAAGENATFDAQFTLSKPALWSIETPNLYRLRAQVLTHGKVVDDVDTSFGIRSIAWDAAHGFRLNGQSVKICGGNIHHDHGALGTVAIGRAEERKIEIMKAAGFNAVRVAHTPASPSFLDICDRLGMLVYAEFTDVWDKSKTADDYHLDVAQWWERDLSAMLMRDRNHPSIIIWSLGNEIPGDPNGYGPKLAALARTLDTTRPIARGGQNAHIGGGAKGVDPWTYADVGDYHNTAPTADEVAAHPDKAFVLSEDTASKIFDDWKMTQENTWFAGTWIWSGWDYIGESGGGIAVVAKTDEEAFKHGIDAITGKVAYPWYVSSMSDIDLIGERRPQNYWRAVVYGASPLEMMVERPVPASLKQYASWYGYFDELESWSWDVPPGHPMIVRLYAAGDAVTLTLNGRAVGTRTLTDADKRVATFTVPYAPGELVATTTRGGKAIGRKVLQTVGQPAGLRLRSDVSRMTTSRDDLAHVLVEVVDAENRLVPDAVMKVSFGISGAGTLAGVANGNPHNVDSFQRPRRWTWHGRALAILRPAKHPGILSLVASTPGLTPARLDLVVSTAPRRT